MSYKTFEDMKNEIPEGATHYSDESDSYHFTWFEYASGRLMLLTASGAWALSMLDREIKPISPKESAQGWNGEGLPPAGVECEFSGVDEDEWERCVVYGTYGEMYFACAWGSELKENDSFLIKSFKFRPIETPQQREERERLEVIHQMVDDFNDADMDYNLRGKVAKVCAALYDSGYRKAK